MKSSNANGDDFIPEPAVQIPVSWLDEVFFLPRITTRAQNSLTTGGFRLLSMRATPAKTSGSGPICPPVPDNIPKSLAGYLPYEHNKSNTKGFC